MQAFIVLALVAIANAGVLLSAGHSTQHRSEDDLGNYAFGYDEKHSTGGSFRQENGSHGVKVGTYGLHDIDGRARTVNYVADAAGYRASIATNEPGTAPSAPAAASYNAAPVAVAAAPASVAASAYVAPVVAAKATTYSTAVQHGAIHAAPIAVATPAVAAYAAPAVIATPVAKIPAPAVYAANVYVPSGAIDHGLYGYGYNHAIRV
ncbi:hypothetical protein BIW11_07095 [Tropilaelaps mercedesae]|uniref:Cuticle protein 14 n=1 Tax=Tropilaelaps mercedesae TaxID=418985 RepID=A0A1V9XVC3_9ACAR|nr:hypothetical protein BIW11_07095 [Tropilaelaps mercedesae]